MEPAELTAASTLVAMPSPAFVAGKSEASACLVSKSGNAMGVKADGSSDFSRGNDESGCNDVWGWVAISASRSLPDQLPRPVGVVGLKAGKLGVLKLGLRALANAVPHGERASWNLNSCFGVSKEFRENNGEVGVLIGVGGSPPG